MNNKIEMQEINASTRDYEAGQFKVTKGYRYAFAIGHYCYPLRATINHIVKQKGKGEITTEECRKLVHNLLGVNIYRVYFDGTGPVRRDTAEVTIDYARK